MKKDIGLIGLAVMGQNLALNMARNGFAVAVFNRTGAKTLEFMDRAGKNAGIEAAYDLAAFVGMLARPRKVFCMIKAGAPVDELIEELVPLLEPGDLILDGGNSYYHDTERRTKELEAKGLRYMGVGVSGGEEGALNGPSIMPGGHPEAWELMAPILTAISAKAEGEPCVAYMGSGSAGHFVKMDHNGIEYGDMQLIAEAYDILHGVCGMKPKALAETFASWNQGVLSSYLIEITADIFTEIDGETGKPLVDMILDAAGQKGTGLWTSQSALSLGVPAPTLIGAVEARVLSSLKEERMEAAQSLRGPAEFSGPKATDAGFVKEVGDALYAAKICSYAQGFALLKAADAAYGYGLNYGEIAAIWRAGCIIRAKFLNDVRAAFDGDKNLANLMLAPFFREALNAREGALRRTCAAASLAGVAIPALSSALAYFDSYRSARLPANLIQAQRDYFGAHTFKRIDKDGVFHHKWGT